MEESLDDKIKRLKSELTVAKQAQSLWEILLDKRELLEEKIIGLKDDVDNQNRLLYQKNSAHDNSKKEALDAIKKNIQTIDDKLDDFEDVSEDILSYLQNQLIVAIVKKNPDQEISYQTLDKNLENSHDLSKKLIVLSASVSNIDKLLCQVLEKRKLSIPLKILQFIFSRNSHFAIARNIHAIKVLCGNSLDLLHDISEMVLNNARAKKCLEELSEILVHLQHFSQKQWNYREIDITLTPIKMSLTKFVNQLDILKKEANESISQTQELIDHWIDKHS